MKTENIRIRVAEDKCLSSTKRAEKKRLERSGVEPITLPRERITCD